MPRPANPEVRRRLLEAGMNLVHARGFAASGVKDITDAAGVPKGSFYAYFLSKEALAEAILEHYWSDIQTRLLPILDEDGSAQERITRFFHALTDDHEAEDFLLGCLIGQMSLELSGSSKAVRGGAPAHSRPLGPGAYGMCAFRATCGRRPGGRGRGATRLAADRGVGGRCTARKGDPQPYSL